MRPAPHPRTVQLLAIFLYLAIIVVGFTGAALSHGLVEPLLAMVGLSALIVP